MTERSCAAVLSCGHLLVIGPQPLANHVSVRIEGSSLSPPPGSSIQSGAAHHIEKNAGRICREIERERHTKEKNKVWIRAGMPCEKSTLCTNSTESVAYNRRKQPHGKRACYARVPKFCPRLRKPKRPRPSPSRQSSREITPKTAG